MALLDDLIAYWKLDESSGTRNDSHSTNHLTENGTVTAATGKINNGCTFGINASNHLSRDDNAALSTGDIDYMFAAWVKLTTGAIGERRTFVSKVSGDNPSYAGEHEFLYDEPTNRFMFRLINADFSATNNVSATTLGAPSVDTWYLVFWGHDSVNNKVYIAVNDQASYDENNTSFSPSDTASPFVVGMLNIDGGLRGLNGNFIDEVGFWKRILTQQERSTLYASGAGFAYPFSATTVDQYRQLHVAGSYPLVVPGLGIRP
jgi:hypothetical protein